MAFPTCSGPTVPSPFCLHAHPFGPPCAKPLCSPHVASCLPLWPAQAISRSRFWGTPIPIWVSDDGEEVVVVGSLEELEQLSGEKVGRARARVQGQALRR